MRWSRSFTSHVHERGEPPGSVSSGLCFNRAESSVCEHFQSLRPADLLDLGLELFVRTNTIGDVEDDGEIAWTLDPETNLGTALLALEQLMKRLCLVLTSGSIHANA